MSAYFYFIWFLEFEMTNTAADSKVARCILCKEVFMQRQTVRPFKNVATVVRVKVVWNVSKYVSTQLFLYHYNLHRTFTKVYS